MTFLRIGLTTPFLPKAQGIRVVQLRVAVIFKNTFVMLWQNYLQTSKMPNK